MWMVYALPLSVRLWDGNSCEKNSVSILYSLSVLIRSYVRIYCVQYKWVGSYRRPDVLLYGFRYRLRLLRSWPSSGTRVQKVPCSVTAILRKRIKIVTIELLRQVRLRSSIIRTANTIRINFKYIITYRKKNSMQCTQCCISRRSKTAKIKCYKL